jgi:hypothetical protein
MKQAIDTKTLDLFAVAVRPVMPVIREEKSEARKCREALADARHEARRWVVVSNPGTEDEDVWHIRFSTYHEALRVAGNCGVRFDVMFRDENGNLTTDF